MVGSLGVTVLILAIPSTLAKVRPLFGFRQYIFNRYDVIRASGVVSSGYRDLIVWHSLGTGFQAQNGSSTPVFIDHMRHQQ